MRRSNSPLVLQVTSLPLTEAERPMAETLVVRSVPEPAAASELSIVMRSSYDSAFSPARSLPQSRALRSWRLLIARRALSWVFPSLNAASSWCVRGIPSEA